ncbi:AraC family transcriptional regulator [Sphingomonas sp. AOB5]|uniref:helix-turn-helix domain-containing protein n=1 Tax=Sphingomonas sp. AOB5 TaxID=3034017 RepID=UPI0023F9B5EB|nr:AraC family transcriptional regulator [Sphingomonas sp. AOB5]MDF7777562.1 AraC family transcriptional regulator [Sphingomonas sp. AOB5]
MDYAELPLPPELDGFVAAVWTLSANSPDWIEHEATPDGCIELIRRHTGRSIWREEQPALFVTGLAQATAKLRFSGDVSFTAIKLWPWAWHALGGAPCPGFADGWRGIAADDPLTALLPETGDPVPGLVRAFDGIALPPIAAVRTAESVAEITRHTGLPHRSLQRLFARDFGMPPRSYLRILRFRDALIEVQSSADPLADAAAATGYADQAHMARDFKALAGLAPREARVRAKGPFV